MSPNTTHTNHTLSPCTHSPGAGADPCPHTRRCHMNTCDARCTARALTHWWHQDTDGELTFCGHHNDRHATMLVVSGWCQLVDEREDLKPPSAHTTT